MNNATKSIISQALDLSPSERILVAEGILNSLDQPDPQIDQLWATEAEARLDAYEQGKLETISSDQVFSKYRK